MLKKLFILCIGFGLAMGLVACQDKNKNNSTEQPANGSDSVTIETMTVTPESKANDTTAQPANPATQSTTTTTTTTTPPADTNAATQPSDATQPAHP